MLEASSGLGRVLSPVLGAGSGILSWPASFSLYAAISIPAVLAVWVVSPEPKKKEKKT
ncbi:MAG: hypothetical protein GX872_04945 [Firmicutes bacterium]|nr:hypothetical protein [Bacillota bacterium]